MRLYLDICAFQRPLDDQRQLRVRIEAEAVLGLLALCESGDLSLVASGVHALESGAPKLQREIARIIEAE